MRVMVVRPGPQFSVLDVSRGWTRGFVEAGAEVVDYNLDDRLAFYALAHKPTSDGDFVRMLGDSDVERFAARSLLADCFTFAPDVVFVVSGFYLPVDILDAIRSRGSLVVLLHTESPYEDDKQLWRAGHADLNLLNDPTNIDSFRCVAPTEYAWHCFDPAVHRLRPAEPDLASDFCFVGTGYPSRVEFLEAVDFSGLDVALGGNWNGVAPDSPLRKHMAHDITECCDNSFTARLYASTRTSVNLYRVEAQRPELSEGWSMGPREVELAAIGVPFLRQPRPEGDALFPFLPTFEGPEDFGDKLRWLLADEPRRVDLGERAREAVADRTFAASAKNLLRLLDR